MAMVATTLHSPGWPQDFNQQVVALFRNSTPGAHTAQLRLNPPELGPVHISISLHDNTAHATFTSSHAAVRLAVENALPQLQLMLSQSGLSLEQASVSDHGHGHGHERHPQSPEPHTLSGSSGKEEEESSGPSLPAQVSRAAGRSQTQIDTFA